MKTRRKLSILSLMLALFMFLFSFGACAPDSDDPDLKPSTDGVVSVTLFRSPSKTEYIVGETFDPSGMVVKITYDDGHTENVLYEDCTYNREALTLNDNQIVITYGGKSATIPIVVRTAQSTSIASIYVASKPTKTEYLMGEKFDPTGLVVKAVYGDNTEVDLNMSELTLSRLAGDTMPAGENVITVNYGTVSTTFTVNVSKHSIRITSADTASYRMEAESTDLNTYTLPSWAAGRSKTEGGSWASNGTILSNLSGSDGYIEYGVYSEIEGNVALYLTCMNGHGSGTWEIDKGFALSWNGETFKSGASVPSKGWSTPQKIYLVTVPLKKGDNTLRLTIAGTCPNLDCVDFVINPDETEFLRIEGESADTTNATLHSQYSYLESSTGASGGKHLSNWWAQKGSYEFKFEAEKAVEAKLYFRVANGTTSAFTIAESLGITLNGTKVETTAVAQITGGYKTYATVLVATVNLKAGENTLQLEILGNFANLDYIEFVWTV